VRYTFSGEAVHLIASFSAVHARTRQWKKLFHISFWDTVYIKTTSRVQEVDLEQVSSWGKASHHLGLCCKVGLKNLVSWDIICKYGNRQHDRINHAVPNPSIILSGLFSSSFTQSHQQARIFRLSIFKVIVTSWVLLWYRPGSHSLQLLWLSSYIFRLASRLEPQNVAQSSSNSSTALTLYWIHLPRIVEIS